MEPTEQIDTNPKSMEESKEAEESEDQAFDNEDLRCRFYRDRIPEKGDLVMVEIIQIDTTGAYVKLLEYDNVEALILATSISTKRIKNVKQHLKLNTMDCMQVITVEEKDDKAFIDLTKRNIQPHDAEEKKLFYDKSKQVHLIMRLTARQLGAKIIDLYEEWGWDLYDLSEQLKIDPAVYHAYDAMKLCLTDPEKVMAELDISEDHKKALLMNIKKKMATAPIKLRTTFKLICYNFDGVIAIKEALLAAKAQTTSEKFELVFQMIVSPEYKVEVVTLDKEGGTAKLIEATELVQKEIKARGGQFAMIEGPHVVGTDQKF